MDVETRKKPLPGVPTIDVFRPPMSKFVFARLVRMVCIEDTKGLYWFGWNIPTSSSLLLVLPALHLQ